MISAETRRVELEPAWGVWTDVYLSNEQHHEAGSIPLTLSFAGKIFTIHITLGFCFLPNRCGR